jgi:GNAT superfamily N-acetyltransferase
MAGCSAAKELKVVQGGVADYERLGGFHYRGSGLGPFAAIFALRAERCLARRAGAKTVAVIVYTMPSVGCELRSVATEDFFGGFDKVTRLSLINKNIRCISRVIIEPRFRGLGLASHLVRETMPRMGVAIVEAMAVMGEVNPFFERAGMQAYTGSKAKRCVQMVEAFSMVGVEEEDLADGERVQEVLGRLGGAEAEFIEGQIRGFLGSYGRRRGMSKGLERTRYVLGKLTSRPVYYIWFNPKIAFSG